MDAAQAAAAATTVTIQQAPTVAKAVDTVPPITGFTTIMGVTVNPMVIVLAIVIAWAVLTLWRGQQNKGKNTFDFWDLVMDTFPPVAPSHETTRRASAIKLFFNGAFLISSWLVIDQEIKLSPMLPTTFATYMATWGLALIAKVIFDAKVMPTITIPGRIAGE